MTRATLWRSSNGERTMPPLGESRSDGFGMQMTKTVQTPAARRIPGMLRQTPATPCDLGARRSKARQVIADAMAGQMEKPRIRSRQHGRRTQKLQCTRPSHELVCSRFSGITMRSIRL